MPWVSEHDRLLCGVWMNGSLGSGRDADIWFAVPLGSPEVSIRPLADLHLLAAALVYTAATTSRDRLLAAPLGEHRFCTVGAPGRSSTASTTHAMSPTRWPSASRPQALDTDTRDLSAHTSEHYPEGAISEQHRRDQTADDRLDRLSAVVVAHPMPDQIESLSANVAR